MIPLPASMIDVAVFNKMVDNVGGLHARLHMLPLHLELVLHLEGWPTMLLRDKRSTPLVQCNMHDGTISKPFSDFDLVDQIHDMHAF